MDPKHPAFPVHPDIADANYHKGLTIRDYIAIEAMKAIIASHPDIRLPGRVSEDAYMFADSLITESNKKN